MATRWPRSIEGIVRTGDLSGKAPVWGVQFHPEHAGGPEDTNPLFDEYIEQVVLYKKMRGGAHA